MRKLKSNLNTKSNSLNDINDIINDIIILVYWALYKILKDSLWNNLIQKNDKEKK